MREILFRAWDKARKEYLSGGEVLIAIQCGKCPKNIFYLDVLKDPDMYKDRFELEQYTGLTDKNGKKIFEGDILRYRETETDDWDVGVVEYKADHGYPAFDMTPYIDCDSNGLSYIMAACTCEAIGNIHDNPELLEESK